MSCREDQGRSSFCSLTAGKGGSIQRSSRKPYRYCSSFQSLCSSLSGIHNTSANADRPPTYSYGDVHTILYTVSHYFQQNSTMAEMLGDVSLLQGALTLTLFLVGAFATFRIVRPTSRAKSSIPRRPCWIPYVGSGKDYFASLVTFCTENQQSYDGAFATTIFGREWYFILEKDDVSALIKSPEKVASMYQAVWMLAGKFLPREQNLKSIYPTVDMEKKISRGVTWNGITAVPMMAHSTRPNKIRAWVPLIRSQLQHKFHALPASGQVDLFAW